MSSSPQKRKANRHNASLSTGPRTPQGKAIVRLNGLQHGLRAGNLLPNENPAEWNRHLAATREAFAPRNGFEDAIIQQIAAATWRLPRVLNFEAALARHAGQRNEAQAERQRINNALSHSPLSPPSLADLQALASLPDKEGFDKLQRYETHAHRIIDRLMQRLSAYRELTRSRSAVPVLLVEVEKCQANPRKVVARPLPALPTVAEVQVQPARPRLRCSE